jgi:hypothetical protein
VVFLFTSNRFIARSLVALGCAVIGLSFAPFSLAAGASHAAAPVPTEAELALKAWNALSPVQKQALAPLQSEWAKMGEIQRKKWTEIASKYSTKTPDEQARIQERMRSWVKLTPQQRVAARENYALTTKVTPEVKSAKWQEYQQLSEADKKRFADSIPSRNRITNIPPASQRNHDALQPLKKGPVRVTLVPLPKPVKAAPAGSDIAIPDANAPTPAANTEPSTPADMTPP